MINVYLFVGLRCRVNQRQRRLSPWQPPLNLFSSTPSPLKFFPQEFRSTPCYARFPFWARSFYTPQITRGISVCMALICNIMMILCIINKFHPSRQILEHFSSSPGTCQRLACLPVCLDIYIHCTMIFWPEKHAPRYTLMFHYSLVSSYVNGRNFILMKGVRKTKKQ